MFSLIVNNGRIGYDGWCDEEGMKHILGIMGSPRRNGNTHNLVAKILDGAREAGAAVDMVSLGDLSIQECDGCHACWRGQECCKQDDMNALYPRIIASDVLVFGTPVYWYGPTALMKGFIDRLVYFNCPEHHIQIAGKQAALAVPFEEDDPATAELLTAFFERCFRYLELRFAGRVLAPGMKGRTDVLQRAECLHEARILGKQLAGW
jgi:multimeric flavodoxin WrbA